MAKGFVIGLFSFFIVIMNMQSGLHLFVYELAKPIIIKNYCVNVDEPELKCNGKCHMKSVLMEEDKATNDANSSNIPPPELKFDSTYYFTAVKDNYKQSLSLTDLARLFNSEVQYHFRESYTDIFHPPIV
jgi:hypothetical protein